MQLKATSRFKILALTLLFVISQFASGATPISQLSAGNSSLLNRTLPEQAYVNSKARRLKNAKVVWVNFEYLREMGYEVPDQMTPEFEQQLTDALAWVIPEANGPQDNLSPQERDVQIDYYGGWGIGNNKGSARALIAGDVQIKGSNLNVMASPVSDKKKYHGRAGLHEAMKDAIWGDLLSRMSPNGANRVVAIIDRQDPVVDGDPYVLIVRNNPNRVGHYVPRAFGTDAADKARAAAAAAYLPQALPKPAAPSLQGLNKLAKDPSPEALRIAQGMHEYVSRVALQYGFLISNRIFLGAESESNILIDAGSIDFGTASSQSGTGKIQFLTHVSPFGDLADVKKNLSVNALVAMANSLPPELGAEVKELFANSETITKTLENEFKWARNREIVKLTGFPETTLTALEGTPELSQLAQALVKIATADTDTVYNIAGGNFPAETSKYNLGRILTALGAVRVNNEARLEQAIMTEVPQESVRASLVEKYLAVRKMSQNLAQADGISYLAFREFVTLQSELRNRPMSDVMLPNLRQKDKTVTESYMQSGDASLIARNIEEIVSNSQRVFKDVDPYSTVVSTSENPTLGTKERVLFNARTGTYEVELKSRVLGDHLYIRGDKYAAADIKNRSALRGSESGTRVIARSLYRQGDILSMTFPISGPEAKISVSVAGARKIPANAVPQNPVQNLGRAPLCQQALAGK